MIYGDFGIMILVLRLWMEHHDKIFLSSEPKVP